MIRAAHGMLPNPAPAVVALLEGVPTWGRSIGVELTTPTGAALLAALSSGFGPMPAMRVTGQGFGAGTRELDELPNCTQVVTGVRTDRATGTDLADGCRGDSAVTPMLAGDASAPTPTLTPASRSRCSRPMSTTPPASSWPTPSACFSMRVPTTHGLPLW